MPPEGLAYVATVPKCPKLNVCLCSPVQVRQWCTHHREDGGIKSSSNRPSTAAAAAAAAASLDETAAAVSDCAQEDSQAAARTAPAPQPPAPPAPWTPDTSYAARIVPTASPSARRSQAAGAATQHPSTTKESPRSRCKLGRRQLEHTGARGPP
eukprot:1159249-Pelagomonas_calceolata.AAC.8